MRFGCVLTICHDGGLGERAECSYASFGGRVGEVAAGDAGLSARSDAILPILRIIALAPNRWHDQWMNRQHLLSRLGLRHRVLYSNGQLATWELARTSNLPANSAGAFELVDNVIVDHPSRLLPRLPKLPIIDRFSMRLASARWRRRLAGDEAMPLILWLFHPIYAPYVESVRPHRVVYHAYDLFSATPGWTIELENAERQLAARADMVIASSQVTAAYLAGISTRPVHFVPNGVDFERFANANGSNVPDELESVPHPRIGYLGSVNPKFDLDLVLDLVARRRDWHWVIVGHDVALDASDTVKWIRLRHEPNVYVLGHQPACRMAAITAAMDVCVLAYRTEGTWTRGIYPLRLHEHLAAGRPVISADFPAIREFPGVVWSASRADDWVTKIGLALEGRGPGTPDARRAVARANTWDARVQTLEYLLGRCVSGSS